MAVRVCAYRFDCEAYAAGEGLTDRRYGMLIVLEGLDGAGKSTQVARIKQYIKDKGLKLKYLHFPRYEAPVYGDLIAKFLRGDFGDIGTVHPRLVALLYALDRADAGKQMREWLDEGYCVLLDRYVYSNIAYQCSKIEDEAGAEELRQWIFDLEYGKYGIPKPDINIFLDVPIGFVNEKLAKTREGADRDYLDGKRDIHEEHIEFQIGVRRVYLRETERDPGFIRINCDDGEGKMLPADRIFGIISDVLKF